jgi:hypothetical protein
LCILKNSQKARIQVAVNGIFIPDILCNYNTVFRLFPYKTDKKNQKKHSVRQEGQST